MFDKDAFADWRGPQLLLELVLCDARVAEALRLTDVLHADLHLTVGDEVEFAAASLTDQGGAIVSSRGAQTLPILTVNAH